MAFAVLSATVFLCSQTCWAEKAYITDAADAQIRSGPSSKNKVVGTLPLGSTVEILKGCEWTLIRYGTPSGENRDGWILSRSVGPRPPVETVARQLESENEALGQRLGESEKQNAALIDKEKQLTDKIRKLESDYEALKSGSANYVKLKEEYDSVKENLVAAQESIQMLNKESESLRLSQRIKWFAAGAAVLAFGLFLGWITGRQQKKRRSNYYM